MKVFQAEVEQAALMYPGIKFAGSTAGQNPLTGMYVEFLCEIGGEAGIDTNDFKKFLSARLPFYARPKRLNFGKIALSHRYKQL